MSKLLYLSLRLLLVTVFVCCAFAGTGPQPVRADGLAAAKYFVLISVDSCRPDYLTLVPTPNIDKLKAQGTFYANSWVGQLCNDTPPGHTSISTGLLSKDSGVLSFNWRNKKLLPPDWDFKVGVSNFVMSVVKATGWVDLGHWFQKTVSRKAIEQNFITSYDNVVSGMLNNFIRDSGANSIGTLYKRAHPGARVAAVSCDKWYACASLAAESADYTVFAEAKGIAPIGYNDVKHMKPAGITGMLPPDYILNDPMLVRDWKDERDSDTWATDVALELIEKSAPEVLLINLPAVDDAGHATGGINAPQRMGEVIANVDLQIGRIMDAYKKSGRFDDTLFVIMSDHGMTPFTLTSSQAALDTVIIKAGNFTNTSPHVYLLFPETAPDVAETIVQANLTAIYGAYYKVKQADGTYSYEPTTSTAKRVTGDLDKCWRYLLGTFAGATSPDIELVMSENSHLDWTMFDCKPFKGQHDSTSWLAQHNILLFSGPGVNKGVVSQSPSRLVDVAPTALALMGITPEKMDGIVLSDALQSPTDRQAHTQISLSTELMPLVDAFKAQSQADLKSLAPK